MLPVFYKTRLYTFMLWTVLLLAANAGAGSVTIPNWSELEHRLFEQPRQVLQTLNQKTVDSWSDRQKARYFDLLTGVHLVFSDLDAAEETLKLGLSYKESADTYTLVNLLVVQAYFRELSGELPAAESGYRSALRIAEQSGEYDALLVAFNALISYYSFSQDEYELALEFVDRANEISASVTRTFLVGDLYNLFGSILSYTGDSEGALRQYDVAESIYTDTNNNVSLSALLYNRATLLEESGEIIAALRTYQLFIERARRWGDPTAEFFGYMGIANIYSVTERFELASSALEQARDGIQYVADPSYLFDFWITAAYIGADVEDFSLTDQAIREVDALVTRVSGAQPSWSEVAVLKARKYIAVAKDDLEQAYEWSESLRHLQVDLLEQEQQAEIAQMRINSESAMYQTETDRLVAENRRQHKVIAGKNQLQQMLTILLAIMTVSLVALVLSLQRKKRQMRILQQYSAISESVKTSSQKVMESVAGLLFDQSERRRSPLSVAVFECHSMADIREQFGQPAVEAVHRWIQQTLEAELREEDKCGQVNYERFMLLLPGADVRLARRQVQRLVNSLMEEPVPGWPQIKLSVSAGVSERSRHDRSPNVLTHRATAAVDIARDNGGLQVKTLII